MSLYPNLSQLSNSDKSEENKEVVLRYVTNKDLEEVKKASINLFKEMSNQISDLKNKVERLEKTTLKKKIPKE